MGQRSRGFVFTINNDTNEDMDQLMALKYVYICFGFEVGDEKGTPHIQGYLLLWDACSLKAMSKRLTRASLRMAKGTLEQNVVYTSKQGDWYEFGERPHQGRAKWDLIKEAMRDPKANPHLFQQYQKMYRMLKLSNPKTHDRKLIIIPQSTKYLVANHVKEQGRRLTLDYSMETYDGEKVVILPCYGDNFVMDWINGHPPKVKRGYELICLDPEIVYIMYEGLKEERYLRKKYLDYIDAFCE